jgi:hypothetical protein
MVLYLRMLGAGLVGYALLAFLGWLPWRLLLGRRGIFPFVLGAPLFGFAVLSVFGWYWLEYGTGGLDAGLPLLLGAVAFATVLALAAQRGRIREWRPRPMWLASAALLALLVFAGLFLHYDRPLSDERLTAASLGNPDIPSYSLQSEELRDRGFDDPGPVVGNDIGSLARVDATGAKILLAADAELTGLSSYEATIPVIGLGALLVALACAVLADRVVPGSPLRAAAIGLTAVAPYVFVFNTGHYYLSQVLSIAPVVAALVAYVHVAEQRDRVSVIRGMAAIALLMLPLVLTYPHMAVASLPVLLVIAWLADGFHDLFRRGGRLLVCAGGGLAGAAAIAAPVVGDAVTRSRELATDEYGFPLPLVTPLEGLGLQRFPSMVELTGPSSLRYFGELAVVVVVVAAATAILVRARAQRPWLGGLIVLAVLGSYRVFYVQQGFSYRQWKWLSFFQPMLGAAFVALLCAAVLVLITRHRVSPRLLRAAGVLALAVWVGVLTSNARTLTDRQWSVVGRDLAALESVAGYALPTVNVELAPYWESMWAPYFLAPTRSRIVADSYYERRAPVARWTVRRADLAEQTGDPAPSLRVVGMDGVYELICRRPPCSLPRE